MTDKLFRTKKIRINGVLTTINVPPSHECYDYWYERIIKSLSLQWLLFKTKLYLDWIDFVNLRARRKYCNKGYHKIYNAHYYVKEGNKRAVSLHFLKCQHCRYMFFPTKNLKDKFIKHEKETKERFSAAFDSLLSTKDGLSMSVSREKKAEGSVRPSRVNTNKKNGRRPKNSKM